MAGDRRFILKSHGDIDQIDTVILGRRDYQELLRKAAYQQCMSFLCSRYTLLFIGFSLTDPDLQLTLDLHRAAFGGHTVNHYALMPEAAAGVVTARRFQKDYGITFLTYTPSAGSHPEVGRFLKDLGDRVTLMRSQRTPIAQLMIAQQSADAQLEELDRLKDSIGPAEHLRRLARVCQELWDNGARRQAWTSITGTFDRNSSTLERHERLEIGIAIATMMIEDVGPSRAAQVLHGMVSDAEHIDNPKLQFAYWQLWARCLLGLHDLDGARTAVERAIALAPEKTAGAALKVRTALVACTACTKPVNNKDKGQSTPTPTTAAGGEQATATTEKVVRSLALVIVPASDASGTAFCIWSTPTKSYFLTNQHVVQGAGEIRLKIQAMMDHPPSNGPLVTGRLFPRTAPYDSSGAAPLVSSSLAIPIWTSDE